jgi:DNA polymerase III subunit epsilon
MSTLQDIQSVVDKQNFVILDTETTGLHDGEIVEIAIIDHLGNTLMDQRIKPYLGIPRDAYRVHGISEDDVKDCPTLNDVIVSIKGHLAGKDVIVYNANYDYNILKRAVFHAGIPEIDWDSFCTWHCAMLAFSPIYGDWNDYHGNYRWQKLTTAASYYGVKVKNAHAALGDCLMTLGVVNSMAKENNSSQSI